MNDKNNEISTSIEREKALEINDEKLEKKNFKRLIYEYFFDPHNFFSSILKNRNYIFIPLILLYISTFLSVYVFYEKVDREAFIRYQINKSKYSSFMTEDKIEKAVEDFKNKNSTFQAIISPFFFYIWLIFVTLIYYFSFMLVGGIQNFWETLSVIFWAELTTFISQIISILVMLIKKGDEILNPKEILISNLGALIGSKNLPSSLFTALSYVDIFIIWNLILLIIGMSIVAKVGKNIASFIILSLFILKVVIVVGFSLVFLS